MKNIVRKLGLALQIVLVVSLVVLAKQNMDVSSFTYNTLGAGAAKTISAMNIFGDTVPWSINRIGAGQVQQQNRGAGVKIAILDTGIDLDHPDLKVAGNISFVPGTTNGDDDNGHGTMVAGVIAALDNNKGVVGVAPKAEIYAVKVLNNLGEGKTEAVIAGIRWAIDNKMQIINMSFGTPSGFGQAEQAVLQEAYDAGILIIAGAGNSGDSNTILAPACYASVIAVGAIDYQDKRAEFSGTGKELDLVAPGTNIMTTTLKGGYIVASGTSIATAAVSGAAALIISYGLVGNDTVRNFLDSNARDLGAVGHDNEYGNGCVDLSVLAKVS